MSILPSAASLLARQVRLIVSPPTTTLFESRSILSEVQSRFGAISTFINQRNDPALHRLLDLEPKPNPSPAQPPLQTILAVFDLPASRSSALDSHTLTIVCGGDLVPSAEELDPYNARSLHGRHHPPKRTFTCRIVEENAPTIHRLAERNPYSGSFRIDPLQMSYRDLNKNGASLKEMADILQTEQPNPADDEDNNEFVRSIRSRALTPEAPSEGFYRDCNGLKDPQHSRGLMAAWKRGIKKQSKAKGMNRSSRRRTS